MTCPDCSFMAARTRKQLDLRRQRINSYPFVDTFACPVCGGKDWATTDEFVVPDEDEPPSWWEQFIDFFALFNRKDRVKP